ncbi:Ig-like domain-containing protein [Nocardioides rubriscoriae]|uniref:Ig-like domain-containing protein n=1 Tax=Nocardioides rubriscoriae TaxID=642762 RepID=UPI0011E00CE5|nr:Ig-like domain-containing protein [Nocardioides rubriscoriae]
MAPRRRRSALVLTGSCAAVLATLAAALPEGPAHADGVSSAPVTVADRVTLRGGGTGVVDVVANDSDPDGDPLELCRVDVPDGVPLEQQRDQVQAADGDGTSLPQPLTLTSTSFEPGTYTVTYFACDFAYLTSGTVTVTVTRTQPVRLRKIAPHVVRFTNPDDRPVLVSFYSFGGGLDGLVEGSVRLPAGEGRRLRVPGRHLSWTATATRTGDPAGEGYLRGLARG